MGIKIIYLSAIALAFVPFAKSDEPSNPPSKAEIASLVKQEAEASEIGILAEISRAGRELINFTVKVTSIDPAEMMTVNDADRGEIETKVWPVHLELVLKYKKEPGDEEEPPFKGDPAYKKDGSGEHHSADVWIYRNRSGKLIALDEGPKAKSSADTSPND
jgi:hypothetical protein